MNPIPPRRFAVAALILLGLLPLSAAKQGSIGPLKQIQSGDSVSSSSARAGSLAFFNLSGRLPAPFHPPSLWRSDGTLQGTFPVAYGTYAGFWTSYGNLMLFSWATVEAPEERDLWRSDGSHAGTFRLTQGLSLAVDTGSEELPTSVAVPERGLVFFSAGPRSESPDLELWATDGTVRGTRLVADVNPEGPSNPGAMTALGGRLFFLADMPGGRELWRSDGTPEGTERVADFHEQGAGIVALLQAGGALFVLVDRESGVELWRSDGTEAGTARVLELPAVRLDSYRAAGRHVFLITGKGSPVKEVWAADGVTGEVVRVLQATSSADTGMLAVGDSVAFVLDDEQGSEPWWSDGTPEGTRRIDLCTGPCHSFPHFVGTYGGRAVLMADNGVSGGVWLTDGTAAGTYRLGGFFADRADEINGWLLLSDGFEIWVSDGTPDGAWKVADVNQMTGWIPLPDHLLFATEFYFGGPVGTLWSLPVTAPPAPPGDWLASGRVPGFRFKVRIAGSAGRQEPACIAETLCVSGALPGRSEVFLRVVGPRPNGRLWPTLVKFSTSLVEVWVQQTATGYLRYYRLEGSGPTGSILPGVVDREGFSPVPGAVQVQTAEEAPVPPSGGWIVAESLPGFRVKARLTSGGETRGVRKEPCISETLCLSGAVAGRPELFVRVVGPKPNGHLWPTLVRFTTATVEVWIEQKKTRIVRYYRLEAPPRDSSDLSGHFDKQGFRP